MMTDEQIAQALTDEVLERAIVAAENAVHEIVWATPLFQMPTDEDGETIYPYTPEQVRAAEVKALRDVIADALAPLAQAPERTPRRGPTCINCGEDNDGGYCTNEGEVGPFCAQCWEFLGDCLKAVEPSAKASSTLRAQVERIVGFDINEIDRMPCRPKTGLGDYISRSDVLALLTRETPEEDR